jgi:phosphomethylpyrimidine synthase
MGELVARAVDRRVQVMVEGIGHAAIDAIAAHVSRAKALCHGVPYRVLPMCTDVALGFDHISGAIAGAVAVAAGADAITCMSRAEHIGLPTLPDLEEAVIATRIAAHAGELVKLRDYDRDRQMSVTRWEAGCKGDWTAAIYPEGAREALAARGRLHDQMLQCAMCGAHCGIAGALALRKLSAGG